MVSQTIKISRLAKGKFFIPKRIGVKAKLAKRLIKNGRATTKGIFFFQAL